MSSMILRKGGCIWPSCGSAMAASARGCELDGPGPIRMRCGTSMGPAVGYGVAGPCTAITCTCNRTPVECLDCRCSPPQACRAVSVVHTPTSQGQVSRGASAAIQVAQTRLERERCLGGVLTAHTCTLTTRFSGAHDV
jgi:hypothetical protein